ncbi:hypothetical protein Tco_1128104 [Tanacetum coccineum]
MQLLELMKICTKLSDKVTALEDELRSTKTDYNRSLITLSKRVKKLENKSLDIEDPSKQGRMIEEIDQDENQRCTARQEQEKCDFEKALELQKHLDEREEVASKSSQDHDIDWSDPAEGYKLSHFKGMKYEEIRPIFESVWDQNQAFVPRNFKIEKGVMKRSGFIQKQSTEEEKEKKKDERSSNKLRRKIEKKASKPKEDKDKRQKKQDDPKKLTKYVEVISDSKEVISVTPLAVKSPIVGWKLYCKEDVGYYEIHKADGSYKNLIFYSPMLNDPKAKESQSGSSKGTKSQPKSSGKSVQSEEPEFKVADSNIPHDQEKNLGNDDVEPKEKVASKRDWITKPTQPQEPTDPGPAFRLLKGTRSNYAELEYDFEECYKALSEKLDWENPEGGDYPFDLTKPLPLVMSGNR